MKFRRLRIAWSVVWGVLALLLIVLWARSYWRVEHILWNRSTESFCVSIYPGQVALESINGPVLMPMGWSHVVFSNPDNDPTSDDEPRTILGFGWKTDDDSITACMIPFWFLALTCTTFALFAIIPSPTINRFSLRTLLIATTLIAMALGAVIWAVK